MLGGLSFVSLPSLHSTLICKFRSAVKSHRTTRKGSLVESVSIEHTDKNVAVAWGRPHLAPCYEHDPFHFFAGQEDCWTAL